MAGAPLLSGHIYHQTPVVRGIFRRKSAVRSQPTFKGRVLAIKIDRVSLRDRTPARSTVDVKRLVGLLYEDLPHVFDDRGIDRTAYDERVKYRDPITKLDGIDLYLFNIALLKALFSPDFKLHWVKQDFWDSIEKNKYFSLQGLWDVFKHMLIYETSDFESPKYQVLKRTANYEVGEYDPFIVVETNGENMVRTMGFNDVRLPTKGGVAAVVKFSGKPIEYIARAKEKALRSSLIRDGLKPKTGYSFACYNDPNRTWSFTLVRYQSPFF